MFVFVFNVRVFVLLEVNVLCCGQMGPQILKLKCKPKFEINLFNSYFVFLLQFLLFCMKHVRHFGEGRFYILKTVMFWNISFGNLFTRCIVLLDGPQIFFIFTIKHTVNTIFLLLKMKNVYFIWISLRLYCCFLIGNFIVLPIGFCHLINKQSLLYLLCTNFLCKICNFLFIFGRSRLNVSSTGLQKCSSTSALCMNLY